MYERLINFNCFGLTSIFPFHFYNFFLKPETQVNIDKLQQRIFYLGAWLVGSVSFVKVLFWLSSSVPSKVAATKHRVKM